MTFDQEALIRSIAVARKQRYMLLLGAGASASSGVPTAAQCVWEWKREVYLSGNPSLSPRLFLDVSLPSVREKVQRWLDSQRTFPPLGDPSEYGFYVEYTYPKLSDRQAYLEKRFSGAVPQAGYQLLAMVQNSLIVQWVWTTNFDGLLRQARKHTHTRPLKEIGLDTAFRIRDLGDAEDCGYLIYLHGDYRYDRLQNTSDETQALDGELRARLIDRVRRQPLVVIGYGGHDESVMSALEAAVSGQPAGGGLYWCLLRDEEPGSRVLRLVDAAKARGLESDLVQIEGFDDLMVRFARYVYREGPEMREVDALLESAVPERSVFSFTGYHPEENWLKSNGYPIDLPRQLYQFEAERITGWAELREIVKATEVVAGLLKGKVLAIGEPSAIASAFAGRLKSQIELVPLSDRDYERSDTVVTSLMTSALQRSLASTCGLMPKGRTTLWDPSKYEVAVYQETSYKAHAAIRLCVNRAAGYYFLNLVPDLHVAREDGNDATQDAVKDVKRQLLGKQWNRAYYDVLEGWKACLLGPEKSRSFHFPPGARDGFVFRLSIPPAYSRLLVPSRHANTKTKKRKAAEQFDAIVLDEPALVFGSARGHPSPKDRHPIRGLVNDGPYDLQLTRAGLCSEVKLGIVCGANYAQALSRYLTGLQVPHSSVETKREYLLVYPGFQQAYRIPLKTPSSDGKEWRALPELGLSREERIAGQRAIAAAVTREIDSLTSIASVDVVLVFVPSAWEPYELIEEEAVSLNLHDHVKAYCAQRGIRTQLLRERTLDTAHQCEVLWWLARALYLKWHRNPYLSKDDAIRVGLQTRQLFHETYQDLPRRVVIHKRTPFLRSERDGLAHALKGVKELEMLTVEHEDAWRFVAYNKWRKVADAFPARRGTLLLLEPHQFFLWVHGATRGLVEENKFYYQGKSRIPVPLKITRFAGHGAIERVAGEILGLSKMDWNSYDLYSQMPATLESSSAIARVGQLLGRFGPETYDYRLFM